MGQLLYAQAPSGCCRGGGGGGADHLTRTSWGNISLPTTQQTFQGHHGGHEAWLEAAPDLSLLPSLIQILLRYAWPLTNHLLGCESIALFLKTMLH